MLGMSGTFQHSVPAGALWGLASAMLYAFYLVLVRRRVSHEDRMDIPMFFGQYMYRPAQP
jgi:solute carrier family 35 protein F5